MIGSQIFRRRLVGFISGVEVGLRCHMTTVTPKERKALMDLKKNKDIMILGADKGRATVIMKTADYRNKIENLLNDKETYEELKKDPTPNFKNKLINILRP